MKTKVIINLDFDDLEAQFQYKNKRLQKQRMAAKAALVDNYGSLADFRAHLPVINNRLKIPLLLSSDFKMTDILTSNPGAPRPSIHK